MELRYNVKGPDRKALVSAIAEIIGQNAEYQRGHDTYKIGEYTVDKEGTLTGPDDISLRVWLAQKGFEAEALPDDPVESQPNAAAPVAEPKETAAEADSKPEEPAAEADTESAESGILTIEMPMDGFSPEKLVNLRKLVDSKANLIKKALEIDDLPIETTEAGTIRFPWFKSDLDGESIAAYSQFVAALCLTARAKSRVTAQAREFPNEMFSMRVFGIGLGLIGPEYRLIRKLLAKNLSGNSAWSSGIDPRRKVKADTGEGGDAE